MLGSAELVELAEAKLHGEPVPLEELRRILRPWLRMQEPPDTVVLGCTHFPLLQEELQRVLPEGTRLIDSGAAIARRTAWLLEHEAPDAKSSDENKAFCMALTAETEQLLPVCVAMALDAGKITALRAFCTKKRRLNNFLKTGLVNVSELPIMRLH